MSTEFLLFNQTRGHSTRSGKMFEYCDRILKLWCCLGHFGSAIDTLKSVKKKDGGKKKKYIRGGREKLWKRWEGSSVGVNLKDCYERLGLVPAQLCLKVWPRGPFSCEDLSEGVCELR